LAAPEPALDEYFDTDLEEIIAGHQQLWRPPEAHPHSSSSVK
jgi:hypothetical protein